MIPFNFPSTAINIGVLPSSANLSVSLYNSLCDSESLSSMMFLSLISLLFPSRTSLPSILTAIPCPGIALNSSNDFNSRFFSSAFFTIASPNGCSDPFSALAASINNSSSEISSAIISVTTGFPSVIVPVLSKTIVLIWCAVSNASPPFIRTPCSAPFPVPTIIAVGVASPNAQGHAITSTAINIVSANTGVSPAISHPRADNIARPITVGTKYADITSASLAIGALLPWASSTNFTICAKAVSLPTFVALYFINPVLFILAPITRLPTDFSTGMLSPVSIDSSIDVFPSTTSPSTGSFSPGLTTIISPQITSSIGIIFSILFLITVAVFGARPINAFIAWDVFPFETASKYLPNVIKVRITAADSKYKCIAYSVSPAFILYIP